MQYGSTDLQALLQITGEGGAWSNPVLTSLLTGQLTNTEEGKTLLFMVYLDEYQQFVTLVLSELFVNLII